MWDFFPLPYFPIKETKTFHWVQFLDHFKADGAFQYLCTHTWKWTLCDPSGEAFLTRELRAVVLCCAPSSAAAWCRPEAAGGGKEEAPMWVTFPNAKDGWCEMAHLKQPPPVSVALLFPCTSSTMTSHCSWLCCTPDKHTSVGLQPTVRLGEVQMPRNCYQMLRTLRKLTLLAISGFYLYFPLCNK